MISYEHLRVIMNSHKCVLVLMSFLWVNRYIGLTILKAKKNLKKKIEKMFVLKKSKPSIYAWVAVITLLQTKASKHFWNNYETFSKHNQYTIEPLVKGFWNTDETLVKHWWKTDERPLKHLWNIGETLVKHQ